MRMKTKTAALGLAAVLVGTPLATVSLASTATAATAPAIATAFVPASASAAAGRPTLNKGAKGPDVSYLQSRLKALHYDPGALDGKYGTNTVYAVWAFQKVNGLKPSSTVGAGTWKALARPKTPKALIRGGAASRIEINLRTQLLVFYKSGKIRLISHISSGSGKRYYSQGKWHTATTPTGNFKIFRRIKGWHRSALGLLYNPVYFSGGVAVHGEGSVPLYPASHGCVRIPVHTGDLVYPLASMGTRVYVRR
jgi:peptidoglycan hydrolase-like protein with peptidoglycan-binding domain